MASSILPDDSVRAEGADQDSIIDTATELLGVLTSDVIRKRLEERGVDTREAIESLLSERDLQATAFVINEAVERFKGGVEIVHE